MKTLREQLDDIFQENRANADLDLAHIAKQMDALLDECYLGLHDKLSMLEYMVLCDKMKQAGYGNDGMS